MSASRPHYNHSTSYSQRDSDVREDVSRHRPRAEDHYSRAPRPRSPSRVRHPYTSNCGRRRWPPSPKVEEVKYEEEIPMRGKIGQDPMIIDVPYATSSDSGSTVSKDSDDSSGPETPPTDSDNRDRRYVWKPEPDIPIPQTYDSVKSAKSERKNVPTDHLGRERGRNSMPRLDTDMGRGKSTGGPPPPLERARSPYASGPPDRKSKVDRRSGEYLLSPDVMTPRTSHAESARSQSQFFSYPKETRTEGRSDRGRDVSKHPTRPSLEAHRAHSHYVPRPVEVHNEREAQHTDSLRAGPRPPLDRRASELPYPDEASFTSRGSGLRSDSLRQPGRPAIDRRASELPYPTSPSSKKENRQRSRRPQASRDDSDNDHAKSRLRSGQTSPQLPRRPVTISSKDGRHHERKFSAELPPSPITRSRASLDAAAGQSGNLTSLVSGAAIAQTLNTILKQDQNTARRASPRPSPAVSPLASPHGSPKSSPYSSPPRTPTFESYQHRSNPLSGLKKDSPSSRPSSPLSSRTSLWTAEPDSPREGRQSRPAPLQSRNTAPLPTPHIERRTEADLLAAPGINVRSPSPAKHAKSFSEQSGQPRQSAAGSKDSAPDHPSRSSDLKPTFLSGRQRSVSSVDVRPALSVNPVSYHPSLDLPASHHPTSRPASPSMGTLSERYRPANLDPASSSTTSGSERAEGDASRTRARSKSRSYVPESAHAAKMANSLNPIPSAPAPRSRSTMPIPAPSEARSRSTAPNPALPAVTPIPPTSLPKCPRPIAIAGYDDWYTLNENSAFIICPSCRDSLFGVNSAHQLQPRVVASSRKTLCDINNPWVLLALTLRGPNVRILSALSEVTSKERSCPEDELAPRHWYRLEDPENGKHISGFNACPHCVHSLEVLLPSWQNVFYRPRVSHSHELKERFCSIRTNKLRFGEYLNMMVESALEADTKRKVPNTAPVSELAKQLANIDDCPKDAMFPRKAWHIHPHLPEFTICPECYENVVYPLVRENLSLAAKIDKKPHQFPNPGTLACCHLYSPRMRKVFKEACEDDDYEHLRHTVLRRHMLQQDMLRTFEEMNQYPDDSEIGDRLKEILAKWKDKE